MKYDSDDIKNASEQLSSYIGISNLFMLKSAVKVRTGRYTTRNWKFFVSVNNQILDVSSYVAKILGLSMDSLLTVRGGRMTDSDLSAAIRLKLNAVSWQIVLL